MTDNGTESNVLSGEWKKESRKRADERGDHRRPRWGGLPREAIEALERARDALRKEDEKGERG